MSDLRSSYFETTAFLVWLHIKSQSFRTARKIYPPHVILLMRSNLKLIAILHLVIFYHLSIIMADRRICHSTGR